MFDPMTVDQLQACCRPELEGLRQLLDARRDAGMIRRCHGDLHLRNVCLIDGSPVLFDCIEFSDALSAIDVLYDLAFLLMDFAHLNLRAEANAVFNRYLDLTGDDGGVPAIRFFMCIWAAIRAHVTAASEESSRSEARAYLDLACRLLEREQPRLIVVGGLSGTGKSTLARKLSPAIGPAPAFCAAT